MLVKFEFHVKISVLSTSVTSENFVTVGRDSNGEGGGVICVNGVLCFFVFPKEVWHSFSARQKRCGIYF